MPSHTDWSSLRVLVGTPCCPNKHQDACWIHPYRIHTSHYHWHLSSPLPLELTNFGGYRAAQADCLCLKENRGIEVAKWKRRMEIEESEEKDKRCSKEPAAVMARCDLRDKPIRVRWEKHSRGKTRKKSKHTVKENELNGGVKFIKESKEKNKRTVTHLKMEHCKNVSGSNVARCWAVGTQCLLWDYSSNKLWTSPEKLKNIRKKIWSMVERRSWRAQNERSIFLISGGTDTVKWRSKMNGVLNRLVLIITSLVDVTGWWRGVRWTADLLASMGWYENTL